MNHEMITDCGGDCGGTCFVCCCGYCNNCGLAEGCLTTECPGEPSFVEHGDDVYKGREDFVDGEWKQGLVSKYSPCYRIKTFLICPVRGHDPEETRAVVKELESRDFDVHWPPRDTDQDDSIGLRICRDNRDAIEAADVVHVVWDGASQGVLFDLGMAFALNKVVIPIELPGTTQGKSFQNMVRAWADLKGGPNSDSQLSED